MTPTRPIRPRRGRLTTALVLVLTLAALAGCSAATTDTTTPGGSTPGGSTAGPVTITHRYGELTIGTTPQRVVTLGAQWTDVLLALDVQPVGYLADPTAGPQGRFPWEDGLAADATPITPAGMSIPLEQVVALQPDLILATFATEDRAIYDGLASIAPTLPLLGDKGVDPWQDLLELGGRIFGKQREAAAVQQAVDDDVAALARKHPTLEGKTYQLVNFVPSDAFYVVSDPTDGAALLFADLGMSIDPDILALESQQGRTKLSLEQAPMLDADLLIVLTNGAEPKQIVGYDNLPAVKAGAVSIMDYAQVSGLNTPSPLSIPYSLEVLTPALEAAAQA